MHLEREGTNPKGVEVKAWGRMGGMANVVQLGKHEIGIENFLIAVHYILNNTVFIQANPEGNL